MNIKRFILSCTVIGFTSIALMASAQESWGCKDAPNKDDCMHAQMTKHMQDHEAKLHDSLKLTAAQEPAWKTFTDSIHQQMSAMQAEHKSMPSKADMDKLSAPEQLENHLAMMQKHMTSMQNHLAALKTFYAVLTPEQQVTMNKAAAKMAQHMHAHGDEHHHN